MVGIAVSILGPGLFFRCKLSATCVFTEEMGLSVGGWTLKSGGSNLREMQVPWATKPLGNDGFYRVKAGMERVPGPDFLLQFRMLLSMEHHQNSKLLDSDLKQEKNKSPGLIFLPTLFQTIYIGTLTWVTKPHLLSQHSTTNEALEHPEHKPWGTPWKFNIAP